MDTTDPLVRALDRLAGVADRDPGDDPMPGIRRKARAHRVRATALAAGGTAAVLAAGVGLASAMGPVGRASGPEHAASPSPSPTPSTVPPPPTEPTLGEWSRARADVDGDGTQDTISVLVPQDEIDRYDDSSWVSEDVRLRVQLASGLTAELQYAEGTVPVIQGTPDLDGTGTAEMVLGFTKGGDSAWLHVYTWDGDNVVQAVPAPGSPRGLTTDADALYSEGDVVGSGVVGGELLSWVRADDEPRPPNEVRVWTWRLEDGRLVATEEDQLRCVAISDASVRLDRC